MSTQYEDKELKCVDDGKPFIWTARDQAFYAEKGFTPPKRCRAHAKARRQYFDENPDKVGGWQKRGGNPRERVQERRRGDRNLLGDD